MAYLVDTNVMVDLTWGNINAADYLDRIRGACVLSSITALELIAGARNQREVTDLDILISAYEQTAPNEAIARRAYALMMAFARSHGLHALDALLAATAIENGFTLVTKNRKHFQMIGALDLEVPDY
jgi:predicted nucleic acid-binding protein